MGTNCASILGIFYYMDMSRNLRNTNFHFLGTLVGFVSLNLFYFSVFGLVIALFVILWFTSFDYPGGTLKPISSMLWLSDDKHNLTRSIISYTRLCCEILCYFISLKFDASLEFIRLRISAPGITDILRLSYWNNRQWTHADYHHWFIMNTNLSLCCLYLG